MLPKFLLESGHVLFHATEFLFKPGHILFHAAEFLFEFGHVLFHAAEFLFESSLSRAYIGCNSELNFLSNNSDIADSIWVVVLLSYCQLLPPLDPRRWNYFSI